MTDLRALAALLRELCALGGITIATRSPTTDEYDAVTLLQPDGDVLVTLSPRCLADPALWQHHQNEVAARLAPLTEVRDLLRRLRRSATIVGVALGLLGAILSALRGEWRWILASVVFGVVVKLIAPRAAALLLQHLLQREIGVLPAIGKLYGEQRSSD